MIGNYLRILILIVSIGLCVIQASAQIDTLNEATKLPAHPRLLLLNGEENLIQKTIKSGKTWQNINQAILAECDVIIGMPVLERKMSGRRLLSTSRECLRRVFFLSYAFRVTKNNNYAKRAEKELLAVSNFSDWNPSHFLDVAEMTTAVAIGYDWLYEQLSTAERLTIKSAILTKGLMPSMDPKNTNWLKQTNNWNQVCNAGMTYGALAIYEDNRGLAQKIINRAIKSIALPMSEYEPDGAYQEGYSYWAYGTSFNVLMISALEKALNKPFMLTTQSGFLKTPTYMQQMVGPTGFSFNYSDSGLKGEFQPAMFWFANRLNNPSLLKFESDFVKTNDVKKTLGDRLLPAAMIWSGAVNLDQVPVPKLNVWEGRGKTPVLLMRSSWTDPKSIFVGMKGGFPGINHGHMDVGSFVMDADGERWAMDFGMENYTTLEAQGIDLWNMTQNSQRWKVFRYMNTSHNTLTINGALQQAKSFAPMVSHSANVAFKNGIVNLKETYPALNNIIRGIAIVNDSYVEVRDEIETRETEVTIRWSMLTATQVKITQKGEVELSKNGKKLTLKLQQPLGVDFKTWSTDSPAAYDSRNPGTTLVGFEIKVPANTKMDIVVALLPDRHNTSLVKTKKLSSWPKD